MFRGEKLDDLEAANWTARVGGAEEKESKLESYEKARQELADFLHTPYSVAAGDDHLIDKIMSEDAEELAPRQFDALRGSLEKISRELDRRLENFVSASLRIKKEKEAAGLIGSLLIEDSNGSAAMPPLYREERHALGDMAAFTFEQSSAEEPAQITYRTFYYDSLLRALARFPEEGAGMTVKCLSEMDSREGVEKGTPDWRFTEAVDGQDSRRDLPGDYNTMFLDPIAYERSEFGRPLTAALRYLAEQSSVAAEAVEYIAKILLPNYLDAAENFSLIYKILEKNGALSARYLMEMIADKKPSPESKKLATKLLYRLEFGKIGISEEGVEYLGKRFDLGERYNRPEYFAHRVTADGKVGIFDGKKRALGYFNLHGLDSSKARLDADVLEFSYETLFLPKPDETEAERREREEVLEEFKEKYFSTYLEGKFYQDTGVAFNNLSLREQCWFLWYVRQAGAEEKRRAKNFIRKFGEDGLAVFLSLQHDLGAGAKILHIGENMGEGSAAGIFSKYRELAEAAMSVGEYLAEKFPAESRGQDDALAIGVADHLLRRGKDLLVQMSAVSDGETGWEETEEKLKRIKKDVFLFAAAVKVLTKKGQVNFESIREVEIATKQSEDLGAEEIGEMKSIFAANRSGEGFTPQFLAAQLKKFDNIMESRGRKFYMLKNEGAIVSFARFDETDEGRLYLGFFNTESEVKGHGIGGAFMKAILEREAQGREVVLDVRVENPAARSYERDFGFKTEKTFVDEKNGATYYRMVRSASARKAAGLKKAA